MISKIARVIELVMSHDEKLEHLSRILTNLIERQISEGDDFEGRANKLLSSIEQLAAHAQSSVELRAQIRKEWGLE